MDIFKRAPPHGAQSIQRAFALLRLVATSQESGVRVVDLVTATGIKRPTVHRMLRVLVEEGVVEHEVTTRRFRIGPELSLLGIARGNRFPLSVLAEPYLRELSIKVQDTVFLTVRHGADSIGVERVTGTYPIQVLATQVGVRRPLGLGVAGVALLATLPFAQAEELVKANKARLAAHGLSVSTVQKRVVSARREGYAWVPAGLVPGTSAVSVAIVDGAGVALGAVSVAAMADRLSKKRLPCVVSLLKDEAQRIALRSAEVKQARHR